MLMAGCIYSKKRGEKWVNFYSPNVRNYKTFDSFLVENGAFMRFLFNIYSVFG